MKNLVAVILFFLASNASASSVEVLSAEYDQIRQVISITTAIKKSEKQSLNIKWGMCHESYPMRCFAALTITPKSDLDVGTETEVMETLEKDVSHVAKPSYLLIRGDKNSRVEAFIGDAG